MKRKILSMILGTAIAASLLTGCGGSQRADGSPTAAREGPQTHPQQRLIPAQRQTQLPRQPRQQPGKARR